jgi:acetyl esterase/lipase
MKMAILSVAPEDRWRYLLFILLIMVGCKKHQFEMRLSSQREDNTILTVTQPYGCSDLRKGVTDLNRHILVANNIPYSNGSYIPDVLYKNEANCNPYGKDTVMDGKGSLVYDVYYLDTSKFTYAQVPPAMIFFHGGGFSDCTSKDGTEFKYCREFAKRGFIVFNVEYRRGKIKDNSKDTNGSRRFSASFILAMYRAFQDARGALRSIIKVNGQVAAYRFDTNKIFVGGTSAGANMALSLAYHKTQNMIDQVFPGISQLLGPINENYYIGDPTIRYTIKGVMDEWGALATPVTVDAATFLGPNINPPVIGFGGNRDRLVPTDTATRYPSDPPLNRDSLGLPFTFVVERSRITKDYGVTGFYRLMQATLNTPAELYKDCGMYHGLDSTTGFGTGEIIQDSVERYIVQRTATFFQAIINGNVSSLKTKRFIDCENFRSGCDINDNNNNCLNSDFCQ